MFVINPQMLLKCERHNNPPFSPEYLKILYCSFYSPSNMVDDSLTSQPKIMCVGANFFDIVQTCEDYVIENTIAECISLRYQRGGNASNSSTVISQFGYPVELFTVFGDCDFSNILKADLRKNNIEFSRCPTLDGQGCPVATVILSDRTGSRTIVYYGAGIRELTLRDFEKINLREYSWIHFEGRNIAEVIRMIESIRDYNKLLESQRKESTEPSTHYLPITISVELEQPDHQTLCLLQHADVVFISTELAATLGCNCMSEGINEIRRLSKAKPTIINAWGDKGAMAYSASDGRVVESAAFSPAKVIDTLGAGDTFNASVLYFLNKAKISRHERHLHSNVIDESDFIDGHVLQDAVTFGCRVAGIKVGIRGYSGLKEMYEQTMKIF